MSDMDRRRLRIASLRRRIAATRCPDCRAKDEAELERLLAASRPEHPQPDRWQALRDWLTASPAVNAATVLARMDELEAGQ